MRTSAWVVGLVLLGGACEGGRPKRVAGEDTDGPAQGDTDDSAAVDSGDTTADSGDTSDTAVDTDDTDPDTAGGLCSKPGYAPVAEIWPLPPLQVPAGGQQLNESTRHACGGAFSNSAVVLSHDVDGDGRPDLVQADVCDEDVVGTDHWEVYLNTGSGFSSTALVVPLPDLGGVVSTSVGSVFDGPCPSSADGEFAGRIFDLDDDGKVDLVVTDDCALDDVGTTRWRLYRGTGTGFEAPVDWALPALSGATDGPLRAFRGGVAEACASGQVWSDLVRGPGGHHLVVTSLCDAQEPGGSVWWTWPPVAGGFASTATVLALPSQLTASHRLDRLSGSFPGCVDNESRWLSRLDMDGDGTADLLMGSVCGDDTSGTDHFTWWPGGAAGFANVGSPWALPPGLRQTDAEKITIAGGAIPGCTDASRTILSHVRDVDGDGRVDLQVYRDCDPQGGLGVDHWDLYRGQGEAFVSPPVRVPLPDRGSGHPPLDLASYTNVACPGRPGDGTLDLIQADLDGDGLRDLTFTSYCDDTAVGRTHWRVHRGVCLP